MGYERKMNQEISVLKDQYEQQKELSEKTISDLQKVVADNEKTHEATSNELLATAAELTKTKMLVEKNTCAAASTVADLEIKCDALNKEINQLRLNSKEEIESVRAVAKNELFEELEKAKDEFIKYEEEVDANEAIMKEAYEAQIAELEKLIQTEREGNSVALMAINRTSEDKLKEIQQELEEEQQKCNDLMEQHWSLKQQLASSKEETYKNNREKKQQIKEMSKAEACKLQAAEEKWKNALDEMKQKEAGLLKKLSELEASKKQELGEMTEKLNSVRTGQVDQLLERVQAAEMERDNAIEESMSTTKQFKEEVEAGKMLLGKLNEWERLYHQNPDNQWGKMYKNMLSQWGRSVEA